MLNYKDIRIYIDRSSWDNNPPPRFLALPNIWRADMDLALLFTALWTRPPLYLGFSLSDWWAWLRYCRAFDNSNDLRLRKEWDDLDAHQKTILSDDLGVGFTTLLFSETLGFSQYVETNFMANVLMPGVFQLGRTSKRGPRKIPDYIALDIYGNYHVLECKGTQSSLQKLDNAIQRGIPQKRNLSTTNFTNVRITFSLVAGLFIPQNSNQSNATIQISDPDWDDLSIFLTDVSERDFLIAIIQISFAKHFALMGIHKLSNELSNIATKKLKKISQLDEEDTFLLLSKDKTMLIFETDYPLPLEEKTTHGEAKRIRFHMDYPFEKYLQLISSEDIYDRFYNIGLGLKTHGWLSDTQEDMTQFKSPLGFTLRLEYI
jgi:hypothetical protein